MSRSGWRIILIALLAWAAVVLAPINCSHAQTHFPTPSGAGAVPGEVQMCLNGSSQAVPCSAVAPIATAGNPYPVGATPITASATGTTAATAATLAGAASVTTYICGLAIIANATAAATTNATVTGTISGTLNFTNFIAANTAAGNPLIIPFSPCIPASAVNTSIVVTSGAPGAGGVVSTTAWGYRL